MKKIYLVLCLLVVSVGTLMIIPTNIKAASQCYYCPNDAVYKWTSDTNERKGCSLVSSISTADECNKKNIATECDFIGNLSCGNTDFQFHKSLPNFTSTIFNILKIITPVIVIITGMLDLLKAVSAQKEDEIKKGQQKLLRRLLAGAIVFLVFVIVETVIHMAAEAGEAENAMDCVDCFLNGSSYCTQNPVTCNSGSGESN